MAGPEEVSILVSEKGSPCRPLRSGLCFGDIMMAAGGQEVGMGDGVACFHSHPGKR